MNRKKAKKIIIYSMIGTYTLTVPLGILFLKGKWNDIQKEYYQKQKNKRIEKEIKHNEIYGGFDLYNENKNNKDRLLNPDIENYELLKKVIRENNLVILDTHFTGYLAVSNDGTIYILDEDGALYNDLDKYLENKKIEDITDKELKEIINITEKKTLSHNNYILLYEPKENVIYQEIYKEGKNIGKAYYKKIDGKNTLYFEDDKQIISASSLTEFAILYESIPYIIMQKQNMGNYLK